MREEIPKGRGNKGVSILLYLAFSLVFPLLVEAAAPWDFDPDTITIHNMTEDTPYYYDFNITANDSDIVYTHTAYANPPLFTIFNMSNSTGLVNFTATNEWVGSYTFDVVARNNSNPSHSEVIFINFTVINANDALNVSAFLPAALNTSVAENESVMFNYTIQDDDLATPEGDIFNASWYLNGTLVSQNASFNYTPGFCEAGQLYNVTLIVNDSGGAVQRVSWNLTVNNTNRAPVLNFSILNKTWVEDTNLTNNETLNLSFSDPDSLECNDNLNTDDLTFSSIGNNSINIVINQTSTNVTFYPEQNFFGNETVIFTVNDGTETVQSNPLNLSVTNVNDAPTFNFTNMSSLITQVLFTQLLNGSDPDNAVQPGTDNLTFHDNSSIINITTINGTATVRGLINITPSTSDFGIHPVNISLTDGVENYSVVVYFNITLNNPPILDPIGDYNITEGDVFVLNVSATDADAQTLTFTTNSSLGFTQTIHNASLNNFSLTPGNELVGTHIILFTVTDPFGISDSETINLSIFDINNPPNLTFIPNYTVRVNFNFSLNITAFDQDNDTLLISTNSSFFNITQFNATAGTLNFSLNSSFAGNYTINFNVTDGTLHDYQNVTFVILNNSVPILLPIGNASVQEDSLLTMYINASDAENDTLAFSSNLSFINFTSINGSSAIINFTPDQAHIGHHWVEITVSDDPLTASRLIVINITFKNDTPEFIPPLQDMNASIGLQFTFYANASDDEGDAINISSNSSIFTINNTNGLINFTPQQSDLGNHTINFSVTDFGTTNWTVIRFQVLPENFPPNITSFLPLEINASVVEGGSLLFNTTVFDPNNDAVTYIWALNGTTQATAGFWLYEPGFSAAGYYNVTVAVSDGLLQTTMNWTLLVNDTNRAPLFGVLNQTLETDFSSGNISQVNITGFSGNITLVQTNGVDYVSSGNFTSTVFNLLPDSNVMNITFFNITWVENRPPNTTIIFQTRTSPNNSSYTNYSTDYTNANGSTILEDDNQYIQYRFFMTTNTSALTPTIEEVVIRYGISDYIGPENVDLLNWIDLDDFFTDLDTGDSLTYSASPVSDVTITIDADGTVDLDPSPDSGTFGSRVVTFYASDGTANVSSNNVTLTFTDVAESTTETTTSSGGSSSSGGGGGGGGSSTRVRLQNIIVPEEEFKEFELIVPERVELDTSDRFIAEIKLKNNENFQMNGISLTASSNTSGLSFSFSESYISSLAPGSETTVDLVIVSFDDPGFFSVKITGDLDDPAISDSATLSIDVKENATQRIEYVKDFLQLSPECLELNDLVVKAQEELISGDKEEALFLLDKAIDGCKTLLSAEGRLLNVEQPGVISLFGRVKTSRTFQFILGLMVILIIFSIAHVAYNRWKWM